MQSGHRVLRSERSWRSGWYLSVTSGVVCPLLGNPVLHSNNTLFVPVPERVRVQVRGERIIEGKEGRKEGRIEGMNQSSFIIIIIIIRSAIHNSFYFLATTAAAAAAAATTPTKLEIQTIQTIQTTNYYIIMIVMRIIQHQSCVAAALCCCTAIIIFIFIIVVVTILMVEMTSSYSTTTTTNITAQPQQQQPIITSSSSSLSILSPLQKARNLQLSLPVSSSATTGGEMEHLEFWQQHETLLKMAWKEWSSSSSTSTSTSSSTSSSSSFSLLPDLDEGIVMNPSLYRTVHKLWLEPTVEQEQQLLLVVRRNESKYHHHHHHHHHHKQQGNSGSGSSDGDGANGDDDDGDGDGGVWHQPIPGVWVCPNFFTSTGVRRIRQHLQAASESGIPTRRPNGMNRYGLVLNEDDDNDNDNDEDEDDENDHNTEGGVSYPQIIHFRQWLVDTYVRPLGRTFFPQYSGKEENKMFMTDNDDDDVESYVFTIHYHHEQEANSTTTAATGEQEEQEEEATTTTKDDSSPKGDVRLPEHSDASLFTMNINLNLPEEEDYEGSILKFLVVNDDDDSNDDNDDDNDNDNDKNAMDEDDDNTTTNTNNTTPRRKKETSSTSTSSTSSSLFLLRMLPGMAVLHRGMTRHEALPIQKGQRHQLIVWLFGTDGYVRAMPYEPQEQKSVKERWSKPTTTTTTTTPRKKEGLLAEL